MSRKVEESENLAEMKLAAAAFQMEAGNTKKSEAEKGKGGDPEGDRGD